MPSDDLRSVPSMEETHRSTLATELKITSLRALADADQRAVYQAMRNIRPRATLARVAKWQSYARSRLSDAATNASDWHLVASFALAFAQRLADGALERRLEAKRADVEPELAHREWPSWDCRALCSWIHGQLGLREGDQPQPETSPAGRAEVGTPMKPTPSVTPAGRARLRIEKAAITDSVHSLDLIRAGTVIEAPDIELMAPVRLMLAVSGGRSGQQVLAAVWFRRYAQPGWSPHEPMILPPSGQTEFDLSPVPAGEHDIRLLAWATDASSTLSAVTLPRLTIRQRKVGGNAAGWPVM